MWNCGILWHTFLVSSGRFPLTDWYCYCHCMIGFFSLHLPELFAFSCLFYHCVSVDVWCISHWKRGDRQAQAQSLKPPGELIFLLPGCRLSPCFGSATKQGDSCKVEGTRVFLPGTSGMVAVPEDHAKVRTTRCVVLLFLMRCSPFHRAFFLWIVFGGDSAAACFLPLFPRGGCLGIEPEKRPVVFSYLCFQLLGFLGIVLHSLILDGQEKYNLY